MDNTTFKKVINELLVPYGFKKNRNNSWTRKGNEVSMKVEIQKSYFSNLYYFRSYYIINNMPIESSGDNECFTDFKYSDYSLLSKMCDLEFDVSDEERSKILRELINKDFSDHKYIEMEADLKKMLVKENLPIFVVIKKYLGIDLQ